MKSMDVLITSLEAPANRSYNTMTVQTSKKNKNLLKNNNNNTCLKPADKDKNTATVAAC
jgi:hypothetical protein